MEIHGRLNKVSDRMRKTIGHCSESCLFAWIVDMNPRKELGEEGLGGSGRHPRSPPAGWEQEGDEHIIPSEVNQTEKDKYYMSSLICGI